MTLQAHAFKRSAYILLHATLYKQQTPGGEVGR